MPALLEWHGPGGGLVDQDRPARRHRRTPSAARATVFVFDPFGLAGEQSHTWSPLRGATTWDGALEVAWRLASAGEVDQRGVEGGDFWAIAAEQRLAPLLYAAARTGAGIDSVVRWAYGQGGRELHEALARATGEAADDARADRRPCRIRRGARVRDPGRPDAIFDRGHRTGAAARIPIRARGALGRARARSPPTACSTSAATLYLIGDAKASKLLRPIFLALLSEVVDRAYERATLAGGRLELPLLLCLDEAGQRRAAAEPRRDRLDRTEPQHPAGLDLPRPRPGPGALRPGRPRPS